MFDQRSPAKELHRRPQACSTFLHSLNLGDLDRATACFSRDACLITPDVTAVHGRDRIRPILVQLIAQGVDIEAQASTSLTVGDIMLATERWVFRSGRRADSRLEQVFSSTLVLKHIEQRWKFAIAAPWGWAGRTG